MFQSLVKLAICAISLISINLPATANTRQAVVENYADIAYAVFQDSLTTAKTLQKSIKKFTQQPTPASQKAAQQAWIAARAPYQQSEVFRFGNAIVDDWEGQLNAWPLDEGLIDYVDNSYEGEMGNVAAQANIIANTSLTLGDTRIDTQTITPELLASLNELGGSEANVATGYHAIEFLLWGQDLNGSGPGAGNRPYTDYVQGERCSNGNCGRRAAYLLAAVELLVDDLESMVAQWQPGHEDNYRSTLLSRPAKQGLTKMLVGMGSLSLGELAGERMKVALEANSTEDEHDCFSDNTHNAHYYDTVGIRNIYQGQYRRIDGSLVKGPSLSALVIKLDNSLDQQTQQAFGATDKALRRMVDSAERRDSPMKFDQMIAEGNQQGHDIVRQAINALVHQTEQLEKVAKLLGVDHLDTSVAH